MALVVGTLAETCVCGGDASETRVPADQEGARTGGCYQRVQGDEASSVARWTVSRSSCSPAIPRRSSSRGQWRRSWTLGSICCAEKHQMVSERCARKYGSEGGWREGTGTPEFIGEEDARRRPRRTCELESEQPKGSRLGFLGVAERGSHGRFIGTDVESKWAGNRQYSRGGATAAASLSRA